MKVKLLPIHVRHAPVYASLRNAENTYDKFFSSKKFTPKEVEGWILQCKDKKDLMYVAYNEEGDLVGAAGIYNIDGSVAEVGRIIVANGYRRQGLAKSILKLLEEIAKNHNINTLYALVKEDNIPSQNLFKSCNYIHQKDTLKYIKSI